jgi:CelD/BcsL family acetyltransferase involved in cellulose biosynthesis
MTATGGWQFEWRRDWADVWREPFERTWCDAFASNDCAHVYHHPALVRAWADTCGRAAGIEPLIGFARANTGQQVLLPWVISRTSGTVVVRRTLEPVGQDLFGYHDPLPDGPASTIDWPTFWPSARIAVSNLCDQALFRFVHAEFAGPDAASTGGDSPVLRLDQFTSFDALLASCSANHRGDVRRRRRRLAERGVVSLWIPGPEEADEALGDWRSHAREAYRDVWVRRAQRNTLVRAGFDEFAARVIADGLRGGWAHYAALRVDGAPIAWHLGLADRGRLYWWIPTHRKEWEPYAPGKVLLAAVIEELHRAKWREIHFMTGAQAYKLAWRPVPADLRVIRWHAPGPRGTILSLYDAVRRSA